MAPQACGGQGGTPGPCPEGDSGKEAAGGDKEAESEMYYADRHIQELDAIDDEDDAAIDATLDRQGRELVEHDDLEARHEKEEGDLEKKQEKEEKTLEKTHEKENDKLNEKMDKDLADLKADHDEHWKEVGAERAEEDKDSPPDAAAKLARRHEDALTESDHGKQKDDMKELQREEWEAHEENQTEEYDRMVTRHDKAKADLFKEHEKQQKELNKQQIAARDAKPTKGHTKASMGAMMRMRRERDEKKK